MDVEVNDYYLEQRNNTHSDSGDEYQYQHVGLQKKLRSLFRHHKQQEECSPTNMIDYGQQRPPPVTPPKLSTTPKEQQLLQQLTTDICRTYEKCDNSFQYDPKKNPRRVLTKPGTPCKNSGYDNRHSDYILYVNGHLGGKYIVLELLGSGTFGQVVKCKNTITGELVAIKVIKNKPAYLRQSTIEVEILKYLNHDYDPDDQHHILRLLEHFTFRHHLCLVFELLSVNLYDLIKQNSFKGLSTKLIRSFASQLLVALVILKEANIIHCDMKPENILLKTQVNTNRLESATIKIIDFGSACQETNRMYTYIQSRFYRSPEVLLGLDYTAAIDMWSFGCIIAELFLGLPLFPGTSEYNQLSRIIDTFGLPPCHMIEQGRNSAKYFNISRRTDNQVSYVFKSRKLYSKEQNRQEKQGKQYFKTPDLDALIMEYPFPKKEMSEIETDRELSNRILLLDFIKRIMCYDPDKRLTPQEALRHPFIRQQSLSPPASLISASPSPPPSIKSVISNDDGIDAQDLANGCVCSVSKPYSNNCPNL